MGSLFLPWRRTQCSYHRLAHDLARQFGIRISYFRGPEDKCEDAQMSVICITHNCRVFTDTFLRDFGVCRNSTWILNADFDRNEPHSEKRLSGSMQNARSRELLGAAGYRESFADFLGCGLAFSRKLLMQFAKKCLARKWLDEEGRFGIENLRMGKSCVA